MLLLLLVFLFLYGVLKDSTDTENYENEEIAKSLCFLYEVKSWVAVTFGKTWYSGEFKSIDDDKIEVLCMERIGRASDSFVQPENEDLGWYSYYEILCYCVINSPVPETRRAYILSRQNLDKIYEFSNVMINSFLKN